MAHMNTASTMGRAAAQRSSMASSTGPSSGGAEAGAASMPRLHHPLACLSRDDFDCHLQKDLSD